MRLFKIFLVVVFSVVVFSIPSMAQPVSIEDFQKQRNQLIQLSVQVKAQIEAFDQIVDMVYQKKLAAKEMQENIDNKYKEINETIKKMEAPEKEAKDGSTLQK